MNDSFFFGVGNIGKRKNDRHRRRLLQSVSIHKRHRGYTLLYNSYGMQLGADKQFDSKAEVLITGTDVLTVKRLVDKELER